MHGDSTFCTHCGAKAQYAAAQQADSTSAPPQVTAEPTVATVVPAITSGSAAAAEPALSSSPASVPTAPQRQPSKNGAVLLLLLVLAAGLGVAAFVLNRPKGAHVLILTPEASTVTVPSGGTVSLGVGVEGTPAELVWRVEEKNSGRIDPSGVTVQGNKIIYHATYHAPLRAGDYHVFASNRENKDQAATIRVEVTGK